MKRILTLLSASVLMVPLTLIGTTGTAHATCTNVAADTAKGSAFGTSASPGITTTTTGSWTTNDIILVSVAWNGGSTNIITAPNGWNGIYSDLQVHDVWLNTHFQSFWHVASNTDTGVTFTLVASTSYSLVLTEYSGANTTNPFDQTNDGWNSGTSDQAATLEPGTTTGATNSCELGATTAMVEELTGDNDGAATFYASDADGSPIGNITRDDGVGSHALTTEATTWGNFSAGSTCDPQVVGARDDAFPFPNQDTDTQAIVYNTFLLTP